MSASVKVGLDKPEYLHPEVKKILEGWNDALGNVAAMSSEEMARVSKLSGVMQRLAALVPELTRKWDVTSMPGQTSTPDATSGMVTNHRGAKAGKVTGRFDLIPPEALLSVAKIMDANLASHGRDSWRKMDRDDHVNHALAHINKWMMGAEDEDHLAHALCRLLFANSRLVEDGATSPKLDRNFEAVYFSHPYANDPVGNTVLVMKYALNYEQHSSHDVVAMVPHNMFRHIDESQAGRAALMVRCRQAVRMCDKIVFCGTTWTPGMLEELDEADAAGIPCFHMQDPHTPPVPYTR